MNKQKKLYKDLSEKRAKLTRRLSELTAEVGKCLTGESSFTVDVLSMSIDTTKNELSEIEKLIVDNENDIELQKELITKIDFYYDQFVSWADEFFCASLEEQKIIICKLIKRVSVRKGYQIEIELNASYRQFFGEECSNNEILKYEDMRI